MPPRTPAYTPLTGHCSCGQTTYSILAAPLITHCCHCTHCARETGSVFAVNILIETSNLRISSTPSSSTPSSPSSSTTSDTHPLTITTAPSASGLGQDIARCPSCFTFLYSHYAGAGPAVAFVRAGTLDDASRVRVRPDVHIYTSKKAPWVDLGRERDRGVGIFAEYYDIQTAWPRESLARLVAVTAASKEKTTERGTEVMPADGERGAAATEAVVES